MEGTFSVSNITDTTATLTATIITPPSQTVQLGVGVTPVGGTELVFDLTVPDTAEVGDTIDIPLSGLTPATVHEVTCTGFDSIEFTTKAAGYNDPRTATQEQWESMVGIIKGKADANDVGTGTLTIQKNGTNVATFSANATSNATANITAPTITMTTTDPGEGSALAADNYIGVYGGDPIIMDYSTTEVDTGAKWIDGSAIYKKTLAVSALSADGSYVTESINETGVSKVLKFEGVMANSSETSFWDISYRGVNVEANTQQISIYNTSGLDLSTYKAYVTLYYTKSS